MVRLGSFGQQLQDTTQIRRLVWNLRRHDHVELLSLGGNTIQRFDQ